MSDLHTALRELVKRWQEEVERMRVGRGQHVAPREPWQVMNNCTSTLADLLARFPQGELKGDARPVGTVVGAPDAKGPEPTRTAADEDGSSQSQPHPTLAASGVSAPAEDACVTCRHLRRCHIYNECSCGEQGTQGITICGRAETVADLRARLLICEQFDALTPAPDVESGPPGVREPTAPQE